ncbi:MAG: type IV-A pilus assembly ATPase PilB [Gammaproteobacteria bacterium]|nr:type IV-A pilus assembly ATPase PilB [Gammaproteobacteria bacterium]
MDKPLTTNVLSGFALYLSENNLIDNQTALHGLEEAKLSNNSYIEYLVKQKILDEVAVARAAAEYFGLPLCDITAFNVDQVPSEYLNNQLVRKQQGLPLFKKNNLLYIAITDPTLENLSEIRFISGLDIRLLVVESSKLTQVINDLLNTLILSEMSGLGGERIDNITVDAYKDEDTTDLASYDIESAPVVNYVNKILLDAIDKGASDVHFEAYENTYRIRFRQHGILYPAATPPAKLANYLLARIKVISNMDITEHRIPQDGRFKLTLSKKRSVDFRVSVCPTVYGEKIVLRILDPANIAQGIDSLGMNEKQREDLLESLSRSQGLILVTGPTGSGKTVTLYSALSFLNSTEKNISTVEDPVEIPLQGINQVHVNAKFGLTFAVALRAFLRQDPDIIMVGEIRDIETAEIAVKAAQTGHLVLSTLHTNSAPETLTRLMNMGIPSYNLASSLSIVIAQRLVRKLCEICKQKEEVPQDVFIKEGFSKEEYGTFQIYAPGTCDHCMRGYKGRMGIFEVMPISMEMSQLIMGGGNALDIMALAKKEGVINLRESGLQKVREGTLGFVELNRVFK